MNKVFVTDKFFKNGAMGFEVGIVNSQNSIIEDLKISTINITCTAKHMVRASGTFDGEIQAGTAIAG